ncbi:hypothetical protein PSTG_20028, partial [Puccinia striiformis f. sp. tritici PST-78]
MARGTWLRDVSATDTTGNTSGQDAFATTPPDIRDGLASHAREKLGFQSRLLDLWVSKTVDIGDQQARIRVGNQVISWGESIFEVGGINATNAIGVNRASQRTSVFTTIFALVTSSVLAQGAGLTPAGAEQAGTVSGIPEWSAPQPMTPGW